MNERKCAFCGCSDPKCLVKCKGTNFWFCNGKGDTSSSHIIHFLQRTNQSEIELPEENPFSKVHIECCVCGSENIFGLGFVEEDGIKPACRDNCQFNESFFHNKKHRFTSLVSNNEISPAVVPRPLPDQYQKIPIVKTLDIINVFKDANMTEEERKKGEKRKKTELKPMMFTFPDSDTYCNVLEGFVNCEMNKTYSRDKSFVFNSVPINWINDRSCTYHATDMLIKASRVGSRMKMTKKGETDPTLFDMPTVKKIDKQKHIVELYFSTKAKLYKTNIVTLCPVFCSVPFMRQLEAITNFRLHQGINPFMEKLMLGQVTEDFAQLNQANPLKFLVPVGVFPPFNGPQKKAAITALKQKYTFIQGPPGTGKTTVLAALVYSLAKVKDLTPILVVGHSNITADFACIKIAQTNLNVGRTYSLTLEDLISGPLPQNGDTQSLVLNSVPNPTIDAVDDDGQDEYLIPGFNPHKYSTYKKAVQAFYKENQRFPLISTQNDRKRLYQIENEIIQQHDVICATASTVGSARMRCTFKAIVFDEAAQLVDPDLLISITKNAERVILVGDHQQLSPVLLSRMCVYGGYGTTLPVRLMLSGVKPNMLLVQYRMHPSIAEFSNKTFYFNKLKNGVSEKDRDSSQARIPWPNPNAPLLFWNIKSEEELSKDSKSYINRYEAECISQIVDHMKENGVNATNIGIITPYSAQQYYLIDNLHRICNKAQATYINNIEISSVDAYQGREKDFIILSCVRSNDSCDIGFLQDEKRLNVSITRAKYGLFVLGNAKTFSKNELWCNFIQSFIDKQAFVEGSLDHFTQSTFEPDFKPTDNKKNKKNKASANGANSYQEVDFSEDQSDDEDVVY